MNRFAHHNREIYKRLRNAIEFFLEDGTYESHRAKVEALHEY
jgi:hypothetical protein